MKKKYLFIGWLLTILITTVWTYENPEKITNIKKKIKIYTPKHEFIDLDKDISKNLNKDVFISNHFLLNLKKIVSLDGKTAFLLNNSQNKKFNINDVEIFTQEAFKLNNNNSRKLDINKNFTEDFNGGLKNVFFINKKIYGLTSSLKKECYYGAIVDLSNGMELLKTSCIPVDAGRNIDFNGLGSDVVHHEDKILLSIGTPTNDSKSIKKLAQNKNSYFGKILSIKIDDFEKKKLQIENFSRGHRNPQGITIINNQIFSVEHGPHGGDELNKIKFGYNYGWPEVSYGTRYGFDDEGKSYSNEHKKRGFEEPLFALVPSVGISSLNVCPYKLQNYYKKNCLIALSLYGNNLRPGKSLLIFLLDEDLKKVHSIEKISLGMPLRHFMTNDKNEIFEDSNGDIYLSSDNNGVFRLNFNNFRN